LRIKKDALGEEIFETPEQIKENAINLLILQMSSELKAVKIG
jgi:hypothetical protein